MLHDMAYGGSQGTALFNNVSSSLYAAVASELKWLCSQSHSPHIFHSNIATTTGSLLKVTMLSPHTLDVQQNGHTATHPRLSLNV